jgi:hypothetical protein
VDIYRSLENFGADAQELSGSGAQVKYQNEFIVDILP